MRFITKSSQGRSGDIKILVVSTCIFPVTPENKYAGIERLVQLIGSELNNRGHEISLAAPYGSQLPDGIEHINTGPCGDFLESERKALRLYESRLQEFGAIIDFSHSHWCMMEGDLPAIAFIWHDPHIMKCQEPGYNICALSRWQAERFKEVYGYEAIVLDPHCGPSGDPEPSNGRYLFIGKMGPNKGCIEAIELCQQLGVPLDIIGTPGPGDPPEYMEKVLSGCHGGVAYRGAVDDSIKIAFLKQARALVYPINYPPGQGEAHSHKIVDALMHGLPVVTYNTGAFPEIIENGANGFLAEDREEFKRLMLGVDRLDRQEIKAKAVKRWSVGAAVDRILRVAEDVSTGKRWGKSTATVEIPPSISRSAPSGASINYQLQEYPRQIRLDTINRCNARCIPCHLCFQKTPRGGKMGMELLRGVIGELKGWPTPPREIVPVNFGEFFLLENWFEVLKLIEESLPQTKIALPSNGSLFSDDLIKKLASVGTLKWFNLSINAFFGETYEAFTGLKVETIDKIKDGVAMLRSLRPDITTCASMVFDTSLQTEVERELFIKLWQPLVSVVSINPASYCDSPLRKPLIPVKTACRSIFDGLVVLNDGRVLTGCCFDSSGVLEIGNINSQSLLDIWRGERLKSLCQLQNEGRRCEIELCSRCSFA